MTEHVTLSVITTVSVKALLQLDVYVIEVTIWHQMGYLALVKTDNNTIIEYSVSNIIAIYNNIIIALYQLTYSYIWKYYYCTVQHLNGKGFYCILDHDNLKLYMQLYHYRFFVSRYQ